jgi:hypothetical protein
MGSEFFFECVAVVFYVNTILYIMSGNKKEMILQVALEPCIEDGLEANSNATCRSLMKLPTLIMYRSVPLCTLQFPVDV